MSLTYVSNTLQHLSGRLQRSVKDLPAPVVTVSAALTTSYVLWKLIRSTKPQPANAPPVVPYLLPFIGNGFQMAKDPAKFIAQCKEKYGPVFQLMSFGQSLIVVTGKQVVDCFRVGEEYLDFQEGIKDLLPTAHIVDVSYDKMKQQEGPEFPMSKNPIIKLVRNNFKSHQLGIYQDRMVDAIERGLAKDIVFKPGDTSTTVDASIFFQKVVARISSQVFAGEAYAENEALIDALATYALNMFRAGIVQAMFPRPIADFITRRYLSVGNNIEVTMKEVAPHLKELKAKEAVEGRSQPTDFMHMMLHTPGADDHEQTPEEAAFWMKDIAFASIHTTSLFLGFALHDLSDRPDIQDILRKEVQETREKYGELTPEVVKDMPIMDSFLRESLRLGSDFVGFRHKAMKDTVLANGITVPKGSTVGLSVYDAHTDPELQDIGPNGIPLTEFDALRFVGRGSKKSTAVGPDFLVFGVGFHSCPGRYFASQEIRYLLACMLERYDVSATTKSGKRAPNQLALGMVQLVPTQPLKLTKRA